MYSDPKRDPRAHNVSVTFVLEATSKKTKAGDDAAAVELAELDHVPKLAFDHSKIVKDYLKSEALLRANRGKKHN